MTADGLMKKMGMKAHEENGAFLEAHYKHDGDGRAASGSIYYYVAADEYSEFHRIDCDEYWCYAEGSPLEVWMIDREGKLSIRLLGVEDGCEPMLYIPKGTIFASRHTGNCEDGTFLTCVTVPRFDYAGFTLIEKSEMLEKYPETVKFYTI